MTASNSLILSLQARWGGAVLLAAMTGSAQSLEHIDEVVVDAIPASEHDRERAFATPEATSITDQSTVRAAAAQSLADALRNSPGVSVQQTTPGQGTIYVRGLSGRAVTHAVDGVRLNTAFFRSGNNDYLGLVDPFALTSVLVVPGATSVEYGSDALGGAVLMTTGLPRYAEESPETGYEAYQSFTTNPLSTASRMSLVHEAHGWAVKAGATYYQAGPIRPGQGLASPEPGTFVGLRREPGESYQPVLGEPQLGTEFEAYASDVVARARLATTTDLILRGQAFVRPELVRYDQITPRFKREVPQRAEAGLRPLSRQMLSVTLAARPWAGWYDTAEVQLAWQRIHEHRFQRNLEELCSVPGPEDADCEGSLRLEPAARRATEDNASNAFSLRAEARKVSPGGHVSFLWGAEARHDLVDSSAETLDLDTLVRSSAPTRYPAGSSLSEAGVFAHARALLLPRLHLFTGVRGSAFHLDIRERAGAMPSPPMSSTLFDVVGSIGTHWEFARGVAWAVNAARGVRSPNIEDFAGLGQRAGGRFQVPNPALGPEHAYTLDTGLKVLRGSTRLQTFIFYAQYRDAITLAPTSVGGELFDGEGNRFYRSVNASSVDLYGFESALETALAPRIRLRGRALLMQGVQHNASSTELPERSPADRVPPGQAELGLSYSPSRDLELEGFVSGRAPQRRLNDPVNLDDNRIPVGGTPGYLTYHLRGTLVRDFATMRLAFDNITDELVLEHGSGFYRAGFSVTGSIELSLKPRQSR